MHMHGRSGWVQLIVVGAMTGALGGVIVRLTVEVLASIGMTILVRSLLTTIEHPFFALSFYYILLPLVVVTAGGFGGVVGATPGYLVGTKLFGWPRPASIRWLVLWSLAGVLVAAAPTITAILAPDNHLPHPFSAMRWAVFGMCEGILIYLLAPQSRREPLRPSSPQA